MKQFIKEIPTAIHKLEEEREKLLRKLDRLQRRGEHDPQQELKVEGDIREINHEIRVLERYKEDHV